MQRPAATDSSATQYVVTTKTPDAWITTKVKTALIANKNIPARNIHVTTKNGMVHLYGTLSNKDQASIAIRETRKIKGVKGVISHLKIAGAASHK